MNKRQRKVPTTKGELQLVLFEEKPSEPFVDRVKIYSSRDANRGKLKKLLTKKKPTGIPISYSNLDSNSDLSERKKKKNPSSTPT